MAESRRLGDLEVAVHARAAVGLAEVRVLARDVELLDVRVALLADLAVHRDVLHLHARRDGLLVEDDVVGAGLVDDPAVRRPRQ